MEWFKHDANFDFMGKRSLFLWISLLFVGLSAGSILVRGFKFGIDFTGGTEIHMRFKQTLSSANVREVLTSVNLEKADVQEFGQRQNNEFLVRVENRAFSAKTLEDAVRAGVAAALPDYKLVSFRFEGGELAYVTFDRVLTPEAQALLIGKIAVPGMPLDQQEPLKRYGKSTDSDYALRFLGLSHEISGAFAKRYGASNVEILRVETVGPKVGQELQRSGALSIIIALLLILVYVAFRFDMKFAPGAVVALVHDVLITLGVFSLFQIEVSLSIVAAVLTIIGYSLNDTIVIYDRIRENLKRFRAKSMEDIINASINQTMSRTILTSLTVLMVTLILLFQGGDILRNFSLALTIGVLAGTYSTVFIASPVVIALKNYLDRKAPGIAK